MISENLMKIQQALKAPKNQTNSFGGYNYRSCEDILEAVKPLLAKEKVTLTLSDEIVEVGGRVYVKATATLRDIIGIADASAPSISATGYAREELERKGMDASQITGSASSYARKYALNGLFCIDDTKDADATNAHGKDEPKPAPKDDYPFEMKSAKKAPKEPQTLYDEEDDGPFCSQCGKRISDKVMDFSVKKFGAALCMDCQKDAR